MNESSQIKDYWSEKMNEQDDVLQMLKLRYSAVGVDREER